MFGFSKLDPISVRAHHHIDADREYAYDGTSFFGRLDNALDFAALNQWVVVDKKGLEARPRFRIEPVIVAGRRHLDHRNEHSFT
jgi:hypothetical protein